ncbi:MAG TPA: FAD-binding oxidoreductase [Candidatus Limnocylindrales bacterium]|nr:FAD-binding oxidoreductase [Candidatus Limnocylindrales bacterium]
MAVAAERTVPPALEGFAGRVITPDDPDYDGARTIYNALINKRPSLIAQCQGIADIVAAVETARDEGLELSVRGGGHGVAGRALTDGGLTIDLSRMKGIHVDAQKGTVRVQPGVTWGQLNRETQVYGRAVTGGVISTTGIAGLTLGGGLGWIMARDGLALDNLLSADVVTAAGQVLRASEDENADLYWALRGGGGNFGVVASFEYRVRPVGPTVVGGLVAHPFSDAPEVLRFYRDLISSASDDLTAYAALIHAPDGVTKLAAIAVCHVGAREDAERELAPLLSFGSPALSQVGPMPYTAVNAMLDAGYPYGSLNYWKSSFMDELTDAAIEVLVDRYEQTTGPMTAFLLEHVHGAATRVPESATAFPHRAPGINVAIPSVWLDPADTDANIAWTQESYAELQPHLRRGRYVNYLAEDDTGEAAARAAYGSNFDRLVEVKTKYDPTNLFRLNANIPPKA